MNPPRFLPLKNPNPMRVTLVENTRFETVKTALRFLGANDVIGERECQETEPVNPVFFGQLFDVERQREGRFAVVSL